MRTSGILNFAALFLFLSTLTFSQVAELRQGFAEPPMDARPRGYWCLVSGAFSLSEMTNELKEYKDKGVGGLDLWDVAGWVDPDSAIIPGPPFMSDESLYALVHAIREAGKYGIDLGFTTASSWNAGGDWIPPELGVQGLFETEVMVQGPESVSLELPFPEIPELYRQNRPNILFKDENGLPTYYYEVAVLAFPANEDSTIAGTDEVINLSAQFNDGVLTWDVPEGNWRIARFVGAGTGQPLMNPSPNSRGLMIDHFSAEATRFHLEYIIDKLEAELGDLSETALKYFYTDSYEANSAAWTRHMQQEFENRRGYDMTLYLPALRGYTIQDEETTERFLHDFRYTLSDMIIENHYQLSKEISAEHGVGFIAEAGGPGPPVHNVPFEALKALGSLSVPRGEFWFNRRDKHHEMETQIVKGPASSANIYDQPWVEAEAFTSVWLWQEGPGDLKWYADRAMTEGLTRFIYHTSPHIPPESGVPGWVYNFGTIINTTRAWWDKSRNFHMYLGRSSYLLSRGHLEADLLLYYGDEAPNFVHTKYWEEAAGFGYDYDVINSDAILNLVDVVDGRLVLPHGQSYSVLVMPDEETANPEALNRIEELVAKGGVLMGYKPERAYTLVNKEGNDEQVRYTAGLLWGTTEKGSLEPYRYGLGHVYNSRDMRGVLEAEGIEPDLVVTAGADTSIDYIHRTTDETEIYFIRNNTKVKQELDISFRVDGKYPQRWIPETAQTIPLTVFTQADGRTVVPLSFTPEDAFFIIFSDEEAETRITAVSNETHSLFPLDEGVTGRGFEQLADGISITQGGEYLFLVEGRGATQVIAEESETIAVTGSWDVRFDHGWGAPPQAIFPELISWTESEDDGIKHFSGTAAYKNTFEITEGTLEGNRVVLDLGKVKEVAEVWLNGNLLGATWHTPFDYDVTDMVKEGTNYLTVEVANNWSNQLTGDASVPEQYMRTGSNIIKGPNAWMYPWEEVPLIESGLMGPVQVKLQKKVQF